MNKIKRTLGFILSHPLSKKHYLKSIFRFLVWQFQCNIFPGKFIIKPYLAGIKFYARKGLTGITGNIYTGLHEFHDMSFLLHLLRSSDVFYDIGANVGSYTLLASGVCKAQSVSIEPNNSAFTLLTQNIVLNNLQDNTYLINAGAGAQKGMIAFTCDNDTTNHAIAQNEIVDNAINIPVIAIDSLIHEYAPLLIKIDVEGYETEVLKGMEKTLLLPTLKAIIIELNGSGVNYGFDDNNIHDLLVSKGFSAYKYDPFTRSLSQTSVNYNYNTMYCRDLDFINDRLKTSEPIKIMGKKF